jgi:Ni,Fe-hydrogenase III small subunit
MNKVMYPFFFITDNSYDWIKYSDEFRKLINYPYQTLLNYSDCNLLLICGPLTKRSYILLKEIVKAMHPETQIIKIGKSLLEVPTLYQSDLMQHDLVDEIKFDVKIDEPVVDFEILKKAIDVLNQAI